MKEYQHVLFDWDGCLYNSLPLWHSTCCQILKDLSITIDESIVARHIMPELGKAEEYGVTDIAAYSEQVLLRVRSEITSVDFQAGAIPLIEYLAQNNISHAVVTSSDRFTIEMILDHHQKKEKFPHIVTRNEVSKTKPHPEPLIKALQLLQSTGSAIMVGDNFADIQAGQAAGMDTVLYYPQDHKFYYNLELLLQLNPTYVISHLDELVEILD